MQLASLRDVFARIELNMRDPIPKSPANVARQPIDFFDR